MMKSDFLNLHSSASGDARRHVPFRSIINKHFSIIFVLIFVFSIMFSYRTSAYALAAPELNPVYNTDIVQLEEYVNGLSSGQMDVFNILLGFYLASQAGAAKYQIEDPYVDQSGVLNWLKSCGVKFYNDFAGWLGGYDPVYGIDKDKFLAVLMGAAVLADQYTDQSDFVSDIENSSNYFLPFNSGLQVGLNQFLASYDGLYNWQFQENFNLNNWFVANNVSGEEAVNFVNYANQLTYNLKVNFINYHNSNGSCNGLLDFDISNYIDYHNLFFNTSSHYYYLCNDNGQVINLSNSYRYDFVHYVYYNGNYIAQKSYFNNGIRFNSYYFSDLNDCVDKLVNGELPVFYMYNSSGFQCQSYLPYFIKNVYYGSDWNNRSVVTNVDDLNFSESSSVSYDQVQTDLLLDIKGLLLDLLDTNELKEPVFNNLYDPSGQPVSDPATVNVSVNAILPESGIDIPNNLFSPLTKDGGYISYLWYMTKPLVQYTSDLVQTLVFPDDTGEGFDITGPGAIVFGVISLGLIGGLVVKCLL